MARIAGINIPPHQHAVCVGEILDLFGQGHTSSFTNFARASATNSKNGGQADLGVLMWHSLSQNL